ncbi:MAG: hypothetical protein ACXVCV_17310 [Polyangia bacterium]
MSEVVESQIASLLSGVIARPIPPVSSKGRPAPVPYDKVVAPRMARAPKGDYRTIRF